jgi:hypothetical protein
MDIDNSLERNKIDAYALYKENCIEALKIKRLQYLLDLVEDAYLDTLLSMLDTIKRMAALGESFISAEGFVSESDSKLLLLKVNNCIRLYREIFSLLGYHIDTDYAGKYRITFNIHTR